MDVMSSEEYIRGGGSDILVHGFMGISVRLIESKIDSWHEILSLWE
jgi:hypothetical protein